MSTINNKKIIDELIANNGRYSDDPQAVMIVEYTNAWGKMAWGVTWENEPFERQRRYLDASEYVINPKIIWQR
jgi:hypothetical protein